MGDGREGEGESAMFDCRLRLGGGWGWGMCESVGGIEWNCVGMVVVDVGCGVVEWPDGWLKSNGSDVGRFTSNGGDVGKKEMFK